MNHDDNQSFGVFKPVGHTVISFASAEQADAAFQSLGGAGVAGSSIRRYTDSEMLRQIEHDLANASPLASIGQERNLIMAHRALAEQGYHWLVVHTPEDAQAAQVAGIAKRCGAERAQLYGNFIIEELIERHDGVMQVGESPDRGLDAQTPSGRESEAAELRPAR